MTNAHTDPVAVRLAGRALARRTTGYADEVRRLLDAALAVMARSGTRERPKVAEIVRAAGTSNEAFYRHFAGKEDLVAAVLLDGNMRLTSYLAHQMGKATQPVDRLRRWIEGILGQAADPKVAASTLAVLWNAGQVSDPARYDHHSPLAALLHPVLAALGSPDPERDAVVVTHAVMGRLEDFLWQRTAPVEADADHLVEFVLAAVGRP